MPLDPARRSPQLIWFANKTAHRPYQGKRHETGSLAQQKRNINGVNAVRLHAELRSLTLPALTLVGGAGTLILRWTVAAAAAW